MSDRLRYVLALVIGLVAIPGLAFATSTALSSSDGSGDEAEVMGAGLTTTSTIDAADLVRACGVEGWYLVELEADGSIDATQQAALDAVRPICDDAGLPLPAAPIGAFESAGAVATAPDVGSRSAAATTTSTTASADGDLAAALQARERALAAIQKAIDMGGNTAMINEALASIDHGDAAYGSEDYAEAADRYQEAEYRAIDAQQNPQATATSYDDDHDDHEDEEREHEEHEHEEHEREDDD